MKWSENLAWLEEEAEADPTFDPPALRERPVLWPHLYRYEAAFDDLSADRSIGFGGAGPIPWCSIDAYATRHGFDAPGAFERLLYMIRALDRAYLDHLAEMKPKPHPTGR